jgi:hypothetical protein
MKKQKELPARGSSFLSFGFRIVFSPFPWGALSCGKPVLPAA